MDCSRQMLTACTFGMTMTALSIEKNTRTFDSCLCFIWPGSKVGTQKAMLVLCCYFPRSWSLVNWRASIDVRGKAWGGDESWKWGGSSVLLSISMF